MHNNIIAIGNFDGVHQGHQSLLALAGQLGSLTVLTFAPHPRQFFNPTAEAFLLTSLNQRVALLKKHGAARVVVQNFDAAFANLTPQQFIDQILHAQLNAHTIVVGPNFKFGAKRAVDINMLKAAGLVVVTPALLGSEAHVISSTIIREALVQGNIAQANQLLGRPWVVQGTVVHGQQRGRTIGFPTANIIWPTDIILPKLGVYAGIVTLPNGQQHKAIANIGTRPTVSGGHDVRLEVHIFNFNADIYNSNISFELHHFIRAEQRFAGLDALQAQIKHDVVSALNVLK
jgi:riboflavin kinase/FMN adenylyltransferase